MAKVGEMVEFLGYAEPVKPEEDIMVVGEKYEVVSIDAKNNSLILLVDNPDFDADEEESEDNSPTIQLEAFTNEVGEVATKAKAKGKAAPKAEVKAAPAAKTKAAAKIKAEPEVAAKPAVKGKAKAATKPAAKAATKPATKAATKGKTKATDSEAASEDAAEEKYHALEREDVDIVELVTSTEDILQLAEELVEEGAALDYKLGGVLYHINLTKAYRDVDERYAERGGFALYVKEHLNMEYRKAMYLVDIYYKFNLYGISGDTVAEIGWTKASKIARVMTEDNAEELVALAEAQSVSDLTDAIKESYVEEGGTAGEKKLKIAFKFRLWEDQAKAVEEVLLATAAAMGFKDPADVFEHIIMEWAAEHPLSAPEETTAKAVSPGKSKAAAASTKAAPKGKAKASSRAAA